MRIRSLTPALTSVVFTIGVLAAPAGDWIGRKTAHVVTGAVTGGAR